MPGGTASNIVAYIARGDMVSYMHAGGGVAAQLPDDVLSTGGCSARLLHSSGRVVMALVVVSAGTSHPPGKP